jgi:hypothetical protein
VSFVVCHEPRGRNEGVTTVEGSAASLPNSASIRSVLAHHFALSLYIDTLVLGIKNRQELAACIRTAEAGPLAPKLINRLDTGVLRPAQVERGTRSEQCPTG